MPHLSRIRIYPIKSLDGHDLRESDVLPSGALRHDRRFALLDQNDQIVNAKRAAALHAIRCEFDHTVSWVGVRRNEESWTEFDLQGDLQPLAEWFSQALSQPLRIIENRETGFPDDSESPGPTLVSLASLRRVGEWYRDLDYSHMRDRMRANLEIDECEPFWEDRLVGQRPIPFQIGDVQLLGMNACARCVVPSRSPHEGVSIPHFREIFMQHRRAELPSWATPSRFNHFYRFTVNTAVERPGRIRVGDVVTLGAPGS